MVKVRVYQEMRQIVGGSEVEIGVDGQKKIGEILNKLVDKYPPLEDKIFDEGGKLNGYINVFINGRNIMTKEGLDTLVKDQDRVALFPPLGGG